jgi:hypothetical protein
MKRHASTMLVAGRIPPKVALHLSNLLSVVDVQHEESGSYHVREPCPTASRVNFTLLKA